MYSRDKIYWQINYLNHPYNWGRFWAKLFQFSLLKIHSTSTKIMFYYFCILNWTRVAIAVVRKQLLVSIISAPNRATLNKYQLCSTGCSYQSWCCTNKDSNQGDRMERVRGQYFTDRVTLKNRHSAYFCWKIFTSY